MKIYVGNIAYDLTEDELRNEFGAYGNVESVSIVTDKVSGRPRGFAFVEMAVVTEGQAAINGLNGKTIKDRIIAVNAARTRPDEDRGGRSRGGYRGGYRGGRDFGDRRQRRY